MLSSKVSSMIEAEILTSRLLPGTFMGQEKQLAAHVSVGRATLRSAIRQLDMLGLAQVRS